ncbi:1-deoxy-D-xylulose-5-phosphate reductoisomerase [Oscillibacter sp.]|uniref:1-deoxy-D-xylulose-5-phosphate reductoisomerase n=1 Tax=Oscillibacter sp. TaxID=1945593 RepID=UPI0028A1BD9A|nr:1-deoxy-D-xylulose-5-phosphate reductoisomerase [Oscillibacter sp.]
MTKTISLLGSTGSIGRQTLDVAEQLNLGVEALAARGGNLELLERQTRQFLPRLVALYDPVAAEQFKSRVGDLRVKVVSGPEGLLEAATIDGADTAVAAVVGMVGLGPTLAAIEQGKRIALANKETLVCAGELVMDAADRHGVEIVPVDSEHSAIFQCLRGCEDRREVKRLLLTCSGGPFYGKGFAELEGMTKQDALRHPNWKMGPKITVDCATLMNKGLEVIEAMRLYRLPLSQVDVLIHRQSIVHSLVEYRDGAVLAQLGTADMRLPIRYAFTYPRRGENPAEPLDLLTCPPLTFAAPDREAFPCFALAEAAAEEGGTACAVLNGANEEAVDLFLQEKIGFNDISRLVKKAREAVPVVYHPTLSDILKADADARRAILSQ